MCVLSAEVWIGNDGSGNIRYDNNNTLPDTSPLPNRLLMFRWDSFMFIVLYSTSGCSPSKASLAQWFYESCRFYYTTTRSHLPGNSRLSICVSISTKGKSLRWKFINDNIHFLWCHSWTIFLFPQHHRSSDILFKVFCENVISNNSLFSMEMRPSFLKPFQLLQKTKH